MIYLDTHVVVWLYAGLEDRFSKKILTLLAKDELYVSPVVILELQYLYETGRTAQQGDQVVQDLTQRLGLQVCDHAFPAIIATAVRHKWTHDPFDRILVAQAELHRNRLLTKDRTIRRHYRQAIWP